MIFWPYNLLTENWNSSFPPSFRPFRIKKPEILSSSHPSSSSVLDQNSIPVSLTPWLLCCSQAFSQFAHLGRRRPKETEGDPGIPRFQDFETGFGFTVL